MRILRLVEERHHRDVEGRPIREGRTPPAHLRSGDIDYKPCHYPGSRHLVQPMNVSALRQAAEHWDEIVDALALLRASYAELRGGFGPDIMDVWRVSQLGCALPWYAILHHDRPAPAYAAALSKITLGTALLAHRLLQDALVERRLPLPLTAQTLHDLAEQTGTLVAETEVCAAPARMIVDFLEVLVAGMPRGVGGVAELVRERDDVLRFGAHYTNLKLLLWIHFLARRFLCADLAATHPTLPGLAELLDAPCEPPDCFVIEPPDPHALAPAMRALWFTSLARLVVPLAPDGSDARLAALAHDVAAIMGAGDAPRATYAALDAGFGDMMRVVERGLGGAADVAIDAAARDRLLASSPRAVLGSAP